jgi:ArsR family transcriptional regulator
MSMASEKKSVDLERLAKQLWALGDPMRLRILEILPTYQNCEHGNNVSQIAEKLELTQPSVSHHLRILRQAGLITNRKMCRDVFYWIEEEAVEKVLEATATVTRAEEG